MNDLERRITMLEKGMRNYKIITAILALMLAATVLVAATTATSEVQVQDVVRCKGLVLENNQGKTSAILQVTKEGVGLFLYDAQETMRVKLGMLETGPGMVFYSPEGKIGASLDMFEEGPKLSLHDAQGTRRFGVTVKEKGQGLSFYDAKGKLRTTLDGAGLDIGDANGTQRALLAIRENNEPTLSFFNPSGMRRMALTGEGLNLTDIYGRRRAMMMVFTDAPALGLYDSQGGVLFKQP